MHSCRHSDEYPPPRHIHTTCVAAGKKERKKEKIPTMLLTDCRKRRLKESWWAHLAESIKAQLSSTAIFVFCFCFMKYNKLICTYIYLGLQLNVLSLFSLFTLLHHSIMAYLHQGLHPSMEIRLFYVRSNWFFTFCNAEVCHAFSTYNIMNF